MRLPHARIDNPETELGALGDQSVWSVADVATAFQYATELLVRFADQAEHGANDSLEEFLQAEAPAVSLAGFEDQGGGEDDDRVRLPPVITFADEAGRIIVQLRITEDGRLDIRVRGQVVTGQTSAEALVSYAVAGLSSGPEPAQPLVGQCGMGVLLAS